MAAERGLLFVAHARRELVMAAKGYKREGRTDTFEGCDIFVVRRRQTLDFSGFTGLVDSGTVVGYGYTARPHCYVICVSSAPDTRMYGVCSIAFLSASSGVTGMVVISFGTISDVRLWLLLAYAVATRNLSYSSQHSRFGRKWTNECTALPYHGMSI